MTKLPTANDLKAKIALAESERASAAVRAHAAAEKEKQALVEKMAKPSGKSDDEVIEKAFHLINRAVENGAMSVQVYRFPHTLCTDNGRAINQAEPGWERTLTGIPKEIYGFWERQLKASGYHIRYEIIDYPGGTYGDVGVTLSWE